MDVHDSDEFGACCARAPRLYCDRGVPELSFFTGGMDQALDDSISRRCSRLRLLVLARLLAGTAGGCDA